MPGIGEESRQRREPEARPGRRHQERRARGRAGGRRLLAVTIGLAGLLAAACQAPGTGGNGNPAPAAKPATPSAQLSITPAAGARNVNPSGGITVTATGGKIKNVTVTGGPGSSMPCAVNPDGTVWQSRWALPTSASLTVTATATNADGKLITKTSSFTTLNPTATVTAHIFEGYQQTYGVGMPIVLTFSSPIANKAAVEKAMEITTSTPVVGAWYWDGSQTLYFRPRDYWPPNTAVSFAGHLDGVEVAPGVFGHHTLTQQFTIGKSLIVVASTQTHQLLLYEDGTLTKNWPISTGKPGDETPNGSYVTIEKGNPVLMTGPGYSLEVPYSVRFTWSGDYLHDAYWSVGVQGADNVSHGCVNMSPAYYYYYYYYALAVPGDPVTITGSPKAGTWGDGYTVWFLTWDDYLKGSALHMAVQAGPSGSTFVDPATLPPSTATAPTGTSNPSNSVAG